MNGQCGAGKEKEEEQEEADRKKGDRVATRRKVWEGQKRPEKDKKRENTKKN